MAGEFGQSDEHGARHFHAVAAVLSGFAPTGLLGRTSACAGETLGATWPEINPDAALWAAPAARMKAGKEHRVPLPP